MFAAAGAELAQINWMHAAQDEESLRDCGGSNDGTQIGLLAIDCIASPIAPNLCNGYTGQAAIEATGKMLRRVARDLGIAVVVTNNAVHDGFRSESIMAGNGSACEGGGGERRHKWKPALGRAWSFVPDRRLLLHEVFDMGQQPERCGHSVVRCCLTVGEDGVRLRE